MAFLRLLSRLRSITRLHIVTTALLPPLDNSILFKIGAESSGGQGYLAYRNIELDEMSRDTVVERSRDKISHSLHFSPPTLIFDLCRNELLNLPRR
jgi:hypothetical protein